MQTRQRVVLDMAPMISKMYVVKAAETELEAKQLAGELYAMMEAAAARWRGDPPGLSAAALEQRREAGARGRQRRLELGRLGGRPRKS